MGRIDKIGVELEGGWKGIRGVAPFADVDIIQDVSVRVIDGATHYGEINSPPLPLEELLPWVEAHYPTATSHYCGLHIHISLKSLKDYATLASRSFYNYFLTSYTEWGKRRGLDEEHQFWKRLGGENRFCFRNFRPNEQLRQRGKAEGRRAHLNFCYRMHGTLECRMLPAFHKVEDAISAIQEFHNIVEGYLEKTTIRNLSLKFKVVRGDVQAISEKGSK